MLELAASKAADFAGFDHVGTMPAYYRGVVPVIDHDHGSAPGLLKHSTATPELPEVDHMEPAVT